MVLDKGLLRFWDHHQERMQEAASTLQILLPEALKGDTFLKLVEDLAANNATGFLARVKLKVWRAGEGLYTPQTHSADWLLTVQAMPAPASQPLQVGICQTVKTLPSPFSSFKGFNSLLYVLASQERARRQLDDLVLLDPAGHVAELTASNLFWIKDQQLFTPALETGCLNGVLRRALFEWASKSNYQMHEGLYEPAAVYASDFAFAGNVTGLKPIKDLQGQALSTNPDFLSQLEKELFH